MFEKEAKEYVNEEYDFCYYPEDNLSTRINAERDWSKGAEFGYNKAKEIIKDYMTIAKGSHTTVCGVPEENRTIYALKLNEEAEQFLNEVEKPIESSVDHIIEQNEKEVGLNPDYFLGGW